MKKLLFIILAIIVLTSCGGVTQTKKHVAEVKQKDCVEVIYFHGKQRCITCNAIENLTKEVIDGDFAEQLKKGELVFRAIDISDKANEKIAEKYEVTWSSLFINKWDDGKETVNNMTDFGFSYAKGSPDKFKEGIKENLEKLLN